MIGCFYLDIFIFQKFYQFCSSFNLAKSENARQPKCTTERKKYGGKGHSRTVDFTGQGMSFLLIWKCSMDKVMILRDIKTDRNDIYLIYCYLF